VLALGLASVHPSWADDSASTPDSSRDGDNVQATSATPPTTATPVRLPNGLEPLRPEVALHPYRLAPGPMSFQNRISISPAVGYLGADRMFAFRAAFYPTNWLGYEGSLGHNPGQSVHAVLHTLNAIVRRPMVGRFQPYATAGYGMILVFPGNTLNADAVTKNALTIGGGTEFYIRGDLALRAEVKSATVFGRQAGQDGIVTYNYLQETIGLAFYRFVRP